MDKRSNGTWQEEYNQRQEEYNQRQKSLNKHIISKEPLPVKRLVGSKSKRVRTCQNIPIKDIDPNEAQDNDCFKLKNQPNELQKLNYTTPKHSPDLYLHYDSFIPVKETYEFFPCEPYGGAEDILGFKEYRGVDMIMRKTGAYKLPTLQTHVFKPYKLLLYRGRINARPNEDDKHRFVYLAQNKLEEVGHCFIRLEEVHNRMRGEAAPFIDDCELAVTYATLDRIVREPKSKAEKDAASAEIQKLREKFGGLLRFRCWTVEGQPSHADEIILCEKLFNTVQGMTTRDHLELFRVWAELLRKSQGDKLGSKEFFGRYWDAVIPDISRPLFEDGMKILVSVTYLIYLGYSDNNPLTPDNREKVREDVHGAVQRVIDAPRLKFKPPLPLTSIIFPDEEQYLPLGWDFNNPDDNRNYRDLSGTGWRTLEAHPGGLYSILINQSVRDFFLSLTLYKQLWQDGYPVPTEDNAKGLHANLTECMNKQAAETITIVGRNSLSAASKNPKRIPTQDRCVAKKGCSANVALSMAYPDIYSDSGKAKKKRVAEWLHRSAFSFGGDITYDDIPGQPQSPNNLVLGSPETNTLMMRYESFVKRVVLFGNKGQGDLVKVTTKINYLNQLRGWEQQWVSSKRYTWLAPELSYSYENTNNSNPRISLCRPMHPMNRETAMLFETLLDKSLEEKCWGWNCWDKNRAVADALIESTAVDGDQEELNKEDLEDMLRDELKERDPQV